MLRPLINKIPPEMGKTDKICGQIIYVFHSYTKNSDFRPKFENLRKILDEDFILFAAVYINAHVLSYILIS